MLGDWFWSYLFDSFSHVVSVMKSTNLISWTDDYGITHTISLFSVLVSYLIVQVLISVLLWCNQVGVFDFDDDDDD